MAPSFSHTIRRLGSFLLLVCSFSPSLVAQQGSAPPSVEGARISLSNGGAERGIPSYPTLPLSFEENRGQTDPQVRFLARGPAYTLFLTPKEAVLRLRTAVVRMRLVGATQPRSIRGVGELPGKSNYLIPNSPQRSKTNIPHYSRVLYEDALSGIDLAYYGNNGQLEYDLITSPGSKLEALSFEFDGASGIQLDRQGRLILHTTAGTLWQNKPLAYQEIDGKRRFIQCEYVLRGDYRVGFQLGAHDPKHRVIIDPVLQFSTHLGGSDSLDPDGNPRLAFTRAVAMAIDSKSNIYIAGNTDAIDFPTTNGRTITFANGGCFQDSENPEPCDQFVAKFTSAGKLVYSTFLGDSAFHLVMPFIRALAVDSQGRAYAAGFGVFDGESAPSFVKKLSADGSAVLYEYRTTYNCFINAVAVDSAGKAYVAGFGGLSDTCSATPGVFQSTPSSSQDAFLAKLDSTQSGSFTGAETVIYFTFLGGFGDDEANAIKVDGNGNAYVAGFTSSTDFPKKSSFGSGIGGAFVAKLNSTATDLVYSAVIHGAVAKALALDGSLNAYITGSATSSGFPRTSGAYRTTFAGGNSDAFVSKLSPGGGILRYSTYLGGANEDHGTGIAVDGSGRAYVGGWTRSSNFPVTSNAVQKTFGGGTCSSKPCADAFVTTLNSSGTGLAFYSTFLGGSASEFANGLVLDPALNVYITGETYSSNYPVTAGAFQTTKKGSSDAFLSKLVIAADLTISKSLTGGAATPGSNITYTVKALNLGPDTSDLPVMTDAIPAGTTFVSASISSGSCTMPAVGGTGTVTCKRQSMTKGAPWTLTLTVKVGANSNSVTNTARISAKTQDLATANNAATVVTPVH